MGYATQVEDIGFPEFTTKLVTDTFDALIAANIRQQQAYIELLQATGRSLTEYANATKDDISPEEIVQLFSAILPPATPQVDGAPTDVVVGGSLNQKQADDINKGLAVTEGSTTANNTVATTGQITQNKYDALVDAAAFRIAATKYTVLKEMVQLGMLRLVVTDGKIETRLNFRAFGSDSFSRHTSDATRTAFTVRAQAKTGGILSNWVKASASTAYSRVRVRTATTSENSYSSVTTEIMGGVTINFRTDYLPVAEA